MNYRETLDYLYSQLPMYQRVGAAAYKPNLDNTIALCASLGNPETKLNTIHIAGTNGKGSVSHMIASVLQSAGYKVGLYTSPHLKDFRERIRINGKMIPQARVVRFVESNKTSFEKIKPSFFEMTVGMAFTYFVQEQVDWAVIETGLGGRLDSTNVISPALSVITNISFDHTALLGNSLKQIATEKAGIIKPGRIALVGEKQSETDAVFISKAKKEGALLAFADAVFTLRNVRQVLTNGQLVLHFDVFAKGTKEAVYKSMRCDLAGLYQQKNIRTALSALALMERFCGLNVPEKAIRKGMRDTSKQTGLKGRWQVLGKKPMIIADTGHNEAGIKEILAMLKKQSFNQLHWVFGAVNDKDIGTILKMLPKKAHYIFCQASIPRALDAIVLQETALGYGLHGEVVRNVKKALKEALSKANKDDLILVGGSTFVVGDVL